MADDEVTEPVCCQRTRDRWVKRIAAYYTSFPVIKDVPCDECRQILELRIFESPAA